MKRLIVLTVVLIFVSIYYLAQWKSVDSFVAAVDHGQVLFLDYYAHYVPAARQFLEQGTPGPGFYYSPFFALLLSPLTKLQVDHLFLPWLLVQVVALITLFLAPCVFLENRDDLITFALYCAVFLTCFPILHNFKWGQVSLPLNALVLLSTSLYVKGWRLPGALALSIPIAIKFYFAIFLPYFIFKKDWKFVSQCVFFAAVLAIAAPASFIGIESTALYYDALFKSIDKAPIMNDINSQHIAALATRFLRKAFGASVASVDAMRTVFSLIGVLVVAVVLAVEFVVVSRGTALASWWCLAFSATLTPFLAPTSWPHYFVLAPFGQLFLLNVLNRQDCWARVDHFVVWFSLIPSVVLAAVPLVTVVGAGPYNFVGCLFFSNLALLSGLLIKGAGKVTRLAAADSQAKLVSRS